MKTLLFAIMAFAACVGVIAYFGYKHPEPQHSLQTFVSISPNGHVVRLDVRGFKDNRDLDAQVDAFLQLHPEMLCTSATFDCMQNSCSITLLCQSAPVENAQDHTGPP
ncbi:MAG TPA: hypothetical protein VMU12_02750 [Candidatus Paceibacterota bacterium]|nr:hypothetical protein [Candidatus Paceibacterota bacterium]